MKETINRETFVKELSNLQNISTYNVDDCAVFYGLWKKYDMAEVASGRQVDKHRWYELSETIYSLGEWFIGVYGVTQLYSEDGSFEDIGIDLIFYEVEQIEKTVYDYVIKG